MRRDDRRLYEKPGHLIRRLQQISLALFMEETKGFDVTPVQYSAILAIELHPGIDQTALCNLIAFDRSTIGDVVGRLERKKLIRRTFDPTDRRTRLLSITPAGRKLLDDIEPAVQATQRRIVEPLTAKERKVLMPMLEKLVHLNNEHSRAPLRLDQHLPDVMARARRRSNGSRRKAAPSAR